jgi:LPXTG-site transpeptidase (sortase) family protein
MDSNRRPRLHAWINRALIALGMSCVIFYGVVTVKTWRFQRDAKIRVEKMVTIERPKSLQKLPDKNRPKTGEVIGRIDIPRLKLSAAMAEGDDEKTLTRAVGHLPDTPLPWHRRGNVGLAAHRDGLFRPLEGIKAKDDVRLVTPRGEYHYRVTKTEIVDPDDVWVLTPTKKPTVTLITCYPFIVQAELVGHVSGTVLTGSVAR